MNKISRWSSPQVQKDEYWNGIEKDEEKAGRK